MCICVCVCVCVCVGGSSPKPRLFPSVAALVLPRLVDAQIANPFTAVNTCQLLTALATTEHPDLLHSDIAAIEQQVSPRVMSLRGIYKALRVVPADRYMSTAQRVLVANGTLGC
jgi:hypothetical protein